MDKGLTSSEFRIKGIFKTSGSVEGDPECKNGEKQTRDFYNGALPGDFDFDLKLAVSD